MYDAHPQKVGEKIFTHFDKHVEIHMAGEKLKTPPTSLILTNQSMRLKHKHLKWQVFFMLSCYQSYSEGVWCSIWICFRWSPIHPSPSDFVFFLNKNQVTFPTLGKPSGVWMFQVSVLKTHIFHGNVRDPHPPSYPFIRPFIEVATSFITIWGAHLQTIEKNTSQWARWLATMWCQTLSFGHTVVTRPPFKRICQVYVRLKSGKPNPQNGLKWFSTSILGTWNVWW